MGRKLKPGTSVADVYPHFAKEWNYSENEGATPDQVARSSNIKRCWDCSTCGHRWWASPNARERAWRTSKHRRTGCPACSHRVIIPGKNDLFTEFPGLECEWDWGANEGLDPRTLAPKTSTKANWVCRVDKSHKWRSEIADRTTGRGCPFCSGHRVRTGVNDLQSKRPGIARELDTDASGFKATEVAWSSEKSAVWRCPDESHSYTMRIDLRTRLGRGCPVCDNWQLLSGYNDLETRAPHLAQEWLEEENGQPADQVLIARDSTPYSWKCSACTHVYQQSIPLRMNGASCPACSGRVLVPGINDLETKRPELLRAWDYENNVILPSEILWSSGRKVWWVCSEGHRAFRSPNDTRHADACGPCAGVAVDPGVTDLETTEPVLSQQWSPKNDRGPHEVSQFSTYKAIWICPDNTDHEWEATVGNRVAGGTGCPHCPRRGSTSAVEVRLRNLLRVSLSDVAEVEPHGATIHDVSTGKRSYSRVDVLAVFKDGRKLVVEYDGSYWHRDKTKMDTAKTENLLSAGYLVVRVREAKLSALELTDPNLLQICGVEPYYGDKRGTELARVLTEVADFLGMTVTQSDFGLAV